MIKSYKELLSIYKNQRQVENAVKAGEYTKISRGIYSSDSNVTVEEYICKRYSNGIITGYTAFNYYNLLKFKDKKCHLATKNASTRLGNPLVLQSFQDDSFFSVGVKEEGKIRIYDKERMLIELFRNRTKYDPKFFKEIVLNYRKQSSLINKKRLNLYLKHFKTAKKIAREIQDIIF